MLIEAPDKRAERDTNAAPVETRSTDDRKLRAIAFAICILFSALVWIAVAILI